jgi:hypothetical protein
MSFNCDKWTHFDEMKSILDQLDYQKEWISAQTRIIFIRKKAGFPARS